MATAFNYNIARRVDSWGGLALCAALYALARARARLGGAPLPPLRATTPPVPGEPPLRPRRILAIKFYGLGNIVMLLPVIGALRRGLPDAEIDFLTLEENRVLLERSGLATRVIGVRTGGYPQVFGHLWRAFRNLRGHGYDAVVDFEQFLKLSPILAYLSGARERIGFNTDGQRRGWLYTRRVVYTDSEHASRIFARLLRPLDIRAELEHVELETRPAEGDRIAALLAEAGVASGRFPVVAVHLGSGDNFYRIPLKRWPLERFAELADQLAERHGAAIVFTGKGAEERALVREALARMRQPAFDLCDRLSITELVALLRSCDLVVANDTSVMHIAAAVRTPVVAFFGPTAPLHYGPGNDEDLVFYRDYHCSPCLTNYNLKVSRCTNPVCIRSITTEEVLRGIERRYLDPDAALRPLLERRRASAPAPAELARAESGR